MVQVVKEGSIELLDHAHSETYWLRNKKPKVDLYRESPFAIDRQLEDQRYLMEKNRNPQIQEFTKVDRLRSDKIVATQGITRPVAMKANVVNKVVREATGIHNYTIIPPPRSITNPSGKAPREKLEPETNPRVRAYASESKAKPVLMSFGHRPRSASRTFHPSTMKFRLKAGEILPTTSSNKMSVGLPVAVLDKVLHAPPITKLDELISENNTNNNTVRDDYYEEEEEGYDDLQGGMSQESMDFEGVNLEESTVQSKHLLKRNHQNHHQQKTFDYEGLFFTKDQQQQLLYNIERHESVYGGKKLNPNSTNNPNNKKKKTMKLQPLNQFSSSIETPGAEDDSWITSHSNANVKIAKSTLSMLAPVRETK
jgi:hypothetical protein